MNYNFFFSSLTAWRYLFPLMLNAFELWGYNWLSIAPSRFATNVIWNTWIFSVKKLYVDWFEWFLFFFNSLNSRMKITVGKCIRAKGLIRLKLNGNRMIFSLLMFNAGVEGITRTLYRDCFFFLCVKKKERIVRLVAMYLGCDL